MTARRRSPNWFLIANNAWPKIMDHIFYETDNVKLPLQIRLLPRQAFWFLANSLELASQANREGMHANALSITRQCLEAISIIELGMAGSPGAERQLERWEADKTSAGAIRKWLEENVWAVYGVGLWSEPWADFMGKLCQAIQPYAHYSPKLAQWQGRILKVEEAKDQDTTLILEFGARSYDPQKASRITLFHGLIYFTLARIWIANNSGKEPEFEAMVERLRLALGKSSYLDGDRTNWGEQFWAMLWFTDGNSCPE